MRDMAGEPTRNTEKTYKKGTEGSRQGSYLPLRRLALALHCLLVSGLGPLYGSL